MADPQEVYDALDAQGIRYEKYQHPPVFTGEEAAEHWAPIPATRVKNLFLRNKKGDRHYLVILEIGKQADLRQLVKVIGDDRLSFGSAERLMAQLGVTPGSVSPFGLLHEGSRERAGDRRSGSPRGRAADLSSQHQHRERDDQRGGLRALSGDAGQQRAVGEAVKCLDRRSGDQEIRKKIGSVNS